MRSVKYVGRYIRLRMITVLNEISKMKLQLMKSEMSTNGFELVVDFDVSCREEGAAEVEHSPIAWLAQQNA